MDTLALSKETYSESGSTFHKTRYPRKFQHDDHSICFLPAAWQAQMQVVTPRIGLSEPTKYFLSYTQVPQIKLRLTTSSPGSCCGQMMRLLVLWERSGGRVLSVPQ